MQSAKCRGDSRIALLLLTTNNLNAIFELMKDERVESMDREQLKKWFKIIAFFVAIAFAGLLIAGIIDTTGFVINNFVKPVYAQHSLFDKYHTDVCKKKISYHVSFNGKTFHHLQNITKNQENVMASRSIHQLTHMENIIIVTSEYNQ